MRSLRDGSTSYELMAWEFPEMACEFPDMFRETPEMAWEFPNMAWEFSDMTWEFPDMLWEFSDMAWEFPEISRISQRTSEFLDRPRALFNFLTAPGIFLHLTWKPPTEIARYISIEYYIPYQHIVKNENLKLTKHHSNDYYQLCVHD